MSEQAINETPFERGFLLCAALVAATKDKTPDANDIGTMLKAIQDANDSFKELGFSPITKAELELSLVLINKVEAKA